MTNKIFILLLLGYFNPGFSQRNSLTSSPYSLFGLGKINDSNVGITNSLGKSGTALDSENELNGLNPASLATIKSNTFFLDIGVKAEYNNYGDKSSSANTKTFSFSNISFGFPLNEKSGISLSLIPYSEVGYTFRGLVENIDGSEETYTSAISGSGGLSNINLNYGRKINNKLNVGVSARYLFGSIKQSELATIENDYLLIEDANYYGGINFGAGMQYQLNKKLNLSGVVNLKTNISGSKDRVVQKIVDNVAETIESSENTTIEKYKTPNEITLGFKYNFKNYYVVGDIKRSFWSSLDLKDDVGKYVDSNMFGLGIERYTNLHNPNKRSFRYRFGFNYDDGNLAINDKKVATSSYYLGVGVPFGNNRKTFFNVSYSYGNKGIVSNILVKENYHTLTINLDFADNWFVKKKYD